jgi:predicted DCC family thiol-disulfide oxidoreductase YuxK
MSDRPTVIYDDRCGMCRRSARTVRRLDWLARLDDMGYSVAEQRYPEVARGALGEGIRLRYPDGSVAIGIDAVRGIAIRTPLGALGAWALYLPGLRSLGALGYAQIAKRRNPEGAACPLPARYERGVEYETT